MMTPAAKAKISAAHRGRVHTAQSRLNMSLAHRGKKQSAETIAKRVAKLRGGKMPPRSEEYRERQRQAHLGKPCPEHVKTLVSELHKGKVISEETRRRMSEAQKKVAHLSNFYVDGRCAQRMHERRIASRTLEYQNWRRAVFARDGYVCQSCGQRGGRLNADHIRPWVSHPDLRYEVSNGRTLCAPCHRKTSTFGRRPR